ncbi:type I restriction enzyme, S subunit [Bacteroidales bacterium KHT7]|nr:type I restriction enzyme, S subunit [Bacteroidales bacterium KHT7]
MSQINELIEKLCPNGVEWKTLGEVLKYEQPTKYIVESNDYSNEGTPVLTAGATFLLGYTEEINGIYTASKDNPVIIFDDFTTSFHWVDFDFKVKSSAMKMLKPINKKVNFRYVYYSMCEIKYIPVEHSRQWIGTYSQFPIPLPPLEIQNRIVEILDHFTNLTANLTAELALRRKQFEHFREKLLSLDGVEGVEMKTLGEVCKKVTSGGTPNTKNPNYYNGDIPWLRTQEVDFADITDTGVKITNEGLENSSAKWIPSNCVIVAMYGATVGKVAINKIPLTTNQACCNLEINEDIALYKFVYYCIENQYNYIKSLGQGCQTNINAQIVKQLQIPVPPLAVQQSIVEQLDKFTVLIQNIENELALRQKQYEYYREKLLSFPSPSL